MQAAYEESTSETDKGRFAFKLVDMSKDKARQREHFVAKLSSNWFVD